MAGRITHEWQGTTLVITSDSGTSSCNLKGDKGDIGVRGAQGACGKRGDNAIADTIVNLEYDATSEHPQAGTAVAEAIAQIDNKKTDRIFATAEGKEITATDSANFPVTGLKLYVAATQGGAGIASPTNIRPITGVDTVAVTISNADGTSGSTDVVTFPQTCYGGYIDWTRNKFMQEWAKVDWATTGINELSNNDESIAFYVSVPRKLRGASHCLSSHLRNDINAAVGNETTNSIFCFEGDDTWGGYIYLRIRLDATETPITTSAEFKQWLIDNDVTVIYRYATPIEWDLAEVLPELSTFYPTTKVSTDGEKAAITYVADLQHYIDNKINELATAIVANG